MRVDSLKIKADDDRPSNCGEKTQLFENWTMVIVVFHVYDICLSVVSIDSIYLRPTNGWSLPILYRVH
jgi:hypothetical protein